MFFIPIHKLSPSNLIYNSASSKLFILFHSKEKDQSFVNTASCFSVDMNHPSSSSHSSSSSSSSLFLMQQESSRSQASSPFYSTNNNYPSMATSPARSSAPNSLHGTPKALSPPRGPSGVSAWVSSTDESSKYRQLPCKTFISVGACPYRDRCTPPPSD